MSVRAANPRWNARGCLERRLHTRWLFACVFALYGFCLPVGHALGERMTGHAKTANPHC